MWNGRRCVRDMSDGPSVQRGEGVRERQLRLRFDLLRLLCRQHLQPRQHDVGLRPQRSRVRDVPVGADVLHGPVQYDVRADHVRERLLRRYDVRQSSDQHAVWDGGRGMFGVPRRIRLQCWRL